MFRRCRVLIKNGRGGFTSMASSRVSSSFWQDSIPNLPSAAPPKPITKMTTCIKPGRVLCTSIRDHPRSLRHNELAGFSHSQQCKINKYLQHKATNQPFTIANILTKQNFLVGFYFSITRLMIANIYIWIINVGRFARLF